MNSTTTDPLHPALNSAKDLHEEISRSEAQLAAGKGLNARKALAEIRKKYNI